MITATSTVKSVSQVTANARPKCTWHSQYATEVGLAPQCTAQVGLIPPVRNSNLSDEGEFCVDRLIRAHFGLNSLI